MNIDIIKDIKNQFPIFKKKTNGKKLHYLDNAALTQVPETVIESLKNFYYKMNSNTHRGVYYLSETATENYENVRNKVINLIGSKDPTECIFVKNTTEGINLVANSFLKNILNEDDEILISSIEHHSNIVPWYLISKECKAKLKIIPILLSGDLDYKKVDDLLTKKTKILAVNHISNSLGTINDLTTLITLAHNKNIPVLIDGAQSMINSFINVKELDCDFFVFSSHKMFGPTGVGVLYAKKHFLTKMLPYQTGGNMVKYVSFSNILWNDLPYKFEAGTSSIANVIAFGTAIDFIKNLDLNKFFLYKKNLFNYTKERLLKIKGLNLIGMPKKQADILSFTINNIHPHDVGTIANHYGVSIRTGHHCCIPVMEFFGLSSTIRVSLSIYNTEEDIDYLIKSIKAAKKIFKN